MQSPVNTWVASLHVLTQRTASTESRVSERWNCHSTQRESPVQGRAKVVSVVGSRDNVLHSLGLLRYNCDVWSAVVLVSRPAVECREVEVIVLLVSRVKVEPKVVAISAKTSVFPGGTSL